MVDVATFSVAFTPLRSCKLNCTSIDCELVALKVELVVRVNLLVLVTAF